MRDESVVGLLGGLGNQLFQVALGYAIEEQDGPCVEFDASAFRSKPAYLGLRELGIELPIHAGTRRLPYPTGRFPHVAIAARKLLGPSRVRIEQPAMTAEQVLAAGAAPAWYYGYWQFPEIVRIALPRLQRELDLSGPPTVQRIGLHVRRGDMLAAERGVTAEVYRASAQQARAATGLPVEVFSDDIPWCRAELAINGAVYHGGGSAAGDLRGLADSAYLVCSPSTFSWWAATLRTRDPDSVFAPARFPSARDLRNPAWNSL